MENKKRLPDRIREDPISQTFFLLHLLTIFENLLIDTKNK